MFRDTKAFSSFSVNDLNRAKQFYTEILSLELEERPEGLELHLAGGGRIFAYPKPDHVPATFTVLNFLVPDVEQAVAELKRLGVRFESYDMPELKTDANGIARSDSGPAAAWFKDPAGNIFAVMEEQK
jgi:catechol 2,3-dioxygenase-like lactoylglutathione lyase family enzyme